MIISIVAPGEFISRSKDEPLVGRDYALEDAASGTNAQNKAFHALVGEYWRSGAHSYNAHSYDEFRDIIKLKLGAGFESYVYASPEGVVKVKTREEIPPEYNTRKYAMGRLKSWADYTKTERRDTLDRLIAEMLQAGINSRKFQEILEGLGHGRTR